jgi:hypothetical protein
VEKSGRQDVSTVSATIHAHSPNNPFGRSRDERPTDDSGGPSGKGVSALCNYRRTAVPVGRPRPSSITHPEVAPATVTCSYIVWHKWILGWCN